MRLTNVQKATYRIAPMPFGNWSGRCPICDRLEVADDVLVPQWAIVDRIKDHMFAAHPVATAEPTRYRVGVIVQDGSDATYNGLTFATREEAETYAAEIAARWTVVKATRIEEVPS